MKDNINFVPRPAGTGKNTFYENRVKPNWNLIRSLLIEGKTEEQVAHAIGISRSTWNAYKKDNEEFKRHIDTSRAKLISEMETRLFELALGVSEERTTTTKKVYNKFTKQWTDIEETTVVNQNKPNNTALIAGLKFLSSEWRKALTNQPDEDKDNMSDVIDSIGMLIDKIQGDDDDEV